jgi:hypothetical protein
MKCLNLPLAFIFLFLAACAAPSTPTPSPTPVPATPIPTSEPTAMPSTTPGVTLTYEEYAQVELVTPTGRHIYIDVSRANIPYMTQDPTAEDILLTTHLHSDHYDPDFQANFPGQQLFTQEGKIELPDVTITGMASAHNANDPIQAEKATDYIYIIDIAGLRIAHFGDIGQEALTDTQLATLGKVDVAITQLSNSYSDMNATNLKGFNLLEQVKPRLIIPTHSDQATIKLAAERWKGYASESRIVTISADFLPAEESLLVLGNLAVSYEALFKLEPWK